MSDKLLDFVGKRVWMVATLVLASAIALLLVTQAYPITIKTSWCTVRDETYVLHDTTYQLATVTQKEGGATVKLCVKEVTRTLKNNLVESPSK